MSLLSGECILHFQNMNLGAVFLKPWKCFIPGRDSESSTVGGPIVFYLCIISVRKRIWHFQNPNIPSTFFKHWKCFPRRHCESRTEGGPIVFYLWIISVRKRTWHFQNPNIPSAFLKCWKSFIVLMYGWDGTGYQKYPSIFFILCDYIGWVYR